MNHKLRDFGSGLGPTIWALGIVMVLAIGFGGCADKIGQEQSEVLVGPYPNDDVFSNLKSHGVTSIVSLLDPSNPYEDTLLQREISFAKQFNLPMLNFAVPADSSLQGTANFQSNVKLAADAIEKAAGKVYLHSYLGVKRTQAVEDLLRARGVTLSNYVVPRDRRAAFAMELDSAQASYQVGHFQEAINWLKKQGELNQREKLLMGWSYYHLPNIPMAKEYFLDVHREHPENDEATTGLAYVAYQQDSLARADTLFMQVLRKHDRDPSATAGMGLLRYKQGRLDDSRKYLRQSLQIDSINVEAGNLLLKIDSIHKRPK